MIISTIIYGSGEGRSVVPLIDLFFSPILLLPQIYAFYGINGCFPIVIFVIHPGIIQRVRSGAQCPLFYFFVSHDLWHRLWSFFAVSCQHSRAFLFEQDLAEAAWQKGVCKPALEPLLFTCKTVLQMTYTWTPEILVAPHRKSSVK